MSRHDVWLIEALESGSYQRMYALALEIADKGTEAGLIKAASRVVQVLEGVIEKPIAPARQLQEARRRFTILQNYLGVLRESRDGATSGSHVSAKSHQTQ